MSRMPKKINSTKDVIKILNCNREEFEEVIDALNKIDKSKHDIGELEKCELTIKALIKAIKLCEKDVLKIPNRQTRTCPACEEIVNECDKIFYCQNCGQKLTWKRILVK